MSVKGNTQQSINRGCTNSEQHSLTGTMGKYYQCQLYSISISNDLTDSIQQSIKQLLTLIFDACSTRDLMSSRSGFQQRLDYLMQVGSCNSTETWAISKVVLNYQDNSSQHSTINCHYCFQIRSQIGYVQLLNPTWKMRRDNVSLFLISA